LFPRLPDGRRRMFNAAFTNNPEIMSRHARFKRRFTALPYSQDILFLISIK
jgi:hypothetical protein